MALHLQITQRHKAFKRNILLSFLLPLSVFGQEAISTSNALPSIIPPSPESYSIGKYGSNPIGLFTGSVIYGVPLYNVKVGDFNLPISVSYGSNGVKVDEAASRIGLQWKMDFAGIVNRTVVGDPDEMPSYKAPTHDTESLMFSQFLHSIAYGAGGGAYEPDQYSYSFPGYSGKFFVKDGKVIQTPYNNLKIDITALGIIITTPNGIIYSFDIGETSVTYASYGYPNVCSPETLPSPITTSWYLTKIRLLNGEEINYIYDEGRTVQNLTGINQTYSYLSSSPYLGLKQISDPIATCFQRNDYSPNILKEIRFANGKIRLDYSNREDLIGEQKLDSLKIIDNSGKVIKKYSFNYQYSYNSNTQFDAEYQPGPSLQSQLPELRKRLFLTKINEQDGTTILSTKFEYDNMNFLPPRLSYSQDYWGYFNGKKNQAFFPAYTLAGYLSPNGESSGGDRTPDFECAQKGILKRIIYPTGGHTEYTYEMDAPSWTLKNKYIYDTFSFSGTLDPVNNLFESGVFTLNDEYSRIEITTTAQPYVYNNDPTLPQEIVPDTMIYVNIKSQVDGQSPFSYNSAAWNVGAYFPRFRSTRGVPLKLAVQSQYPPNVSFIVKIYTPRYNFQPFEYPIGGVRVKSLADYNEYGQLTNKKYFEYDWSELRNVTNNFSGQNPDNEGQFYSTHTRFDPNQNFYYEVQQIMSNSLYPLYLNDLTNINYPRVIEKWVDNSEKVVGGIEHYFLVKEKNKPTVFGNVSTPEYVWQYNNHVVPGARYSNNDLHNGLELESNVFEIDNQNKKIYKNKTKNFYSVDSRIFGIDTFYAIRTLISNRNQYVPEWKYFADFDVNRYFIYSNWMHLDSTVKKSFSSTSDSLINKQEYTYGSTAHIQPTSINTINNKNENIKTVYKYPEDFMVMGIFPYREMVSKNIIIPVIEQTLTINNQPSFFSKTNYDGFISNSLYLPKFIEQKIRFAPIESRISFNLYDPHGNILEQQKTNDVKEVLLWGYNSQYPVAKIVGNKSYNDIIAQSGIDTAQLRNPASDAWLRNYLNTLRNISGVMVSTYTYAPLIGITSETDSKGNTTYYEYDGFGRLMQAKDKDGNIIKKYDYHYSN